MQNIIVEKEEDAKEIIKFLEDKKAGKATFLPLSKFRYSEGINASESSKPNSKSNLNSNLNLKSQLDFSNFCLVLNFKKPAALKFLLRIIYAYHHIFLIKI